MNATVASSHARTRPRFCGDAIAVVGLLSSCVVPGNSNAVVFTVEQRAAIGNIELYPIHMNAKAWQGIDATDGGVAGGIAHKAYRFSGGDKIIGAIGGSTSSGIARGQKRDFDGRNADILPQLQAACGESLVSETGLDSARLEAARALSGQYLWI